MRTIIDADRLPPAVQYYTKFPGEPAQEVKNFISVDPLEASHALTLDSLLRRLDACSSGGEKEFMIVLHSNPDGLRLPLGTGPQAGIYADKSLLNILTLASDALGNLDDSKNPSMAVNDAFLRSWTDFFAQAQKAENKGKSIDTSAIDQASGVAAKCAEAAKLGQLWVDAVCKLLHMNEVRLREIVALGDKVRASGLRRLEFRSCRLGAGEGLQEVANYFGSLSFAPTVRTFYIPDPVNIVPNQTQLNRIASGLGPLSRRFTATQAPAGVTDNVAFAIQVTSLPHSVYNSRLYAVSEQALWSWVSNFILRLPTSATVNNVPITIPTGHTLRRDLVIEGFWTPGTAKPFVFPGEDDYRDFLEGKS